MIVAFTDRPRIRPQAQWYYYLDCRWSGGDPDKPALEVVNGVEVEKKMGAYETGLANVLNRLLGNFIREHDLGQSFVNMEIELPGVGSRRKPDVSYISTETWPLSRRIPSEPWWHIAPDLAVEVVSPYELSHATLAKVQEYFAAGVKVVWLVCPNIEHVYVYTSPAQIRVLTRTDTLTAEPLFTGFRLPLSELFPETIDEPTPAETP